MGEAQGNEFERSVHRSTALTPLIFAGAPLVIAFLAGLFTDFGARVNPAFFAIMSEGVLPVLLIAAIVEWGSWRAAIWSCNRARRPNTG